MKANGGNCYLACSCCGDAVMCQILLDKLLYDTDRAIDLYTLGSDPAGRSEPEWRAAAYGVLVKEFEFNYVAHCLGSLGPSANGEPAPSGLSAHTPSPPPTPGDEDTPSPPTCIDTVGNCGVGPRNCTPRLQELSDIIAEIQELLVEDKIPDITAPTVSVLAETLVSKSARRGSGELFVFDLPLARFHDSGQVHAALQVTGSGVSRACLLEMTGTRRITEPDTGNVTAESLGVPVNIPVNVCRNTVVVIGNLNPSLGNTCING